MKTLFNNQAIDMCDYEVSKQVDFDNPVCHFCFKAKHLHLEVVHETALRLHVSTFLLYLCLAPLSCPKLSLNVFYISSGRLGAAA
jgi:hypothetical protein